MRLIIIPFIIFLTAAVSYAQQDGFYSLDADSLQYHKRIWLGGEWKFHSGDDPQWADPDFDDTTWPLLPSHLSALGEADDNMWNGFGWFRFHLDVDTALTGKILGLNINHYGASQIYINGELIKEIGKIDSAGNEIGYRELNPLAVIFPRIKNVIAIRYANHIESESLNEIGYKGFHVTIGHLDYSIFKRIKWALFYTRYEMILIVFSLLLALIHLILYLFDRRKLQNLYFTLLAVSFALFAYFNLHHRLLSDPAIIIFYNKMVIVTIAFAVIFLLLTIYMIFYSKIPKRFYFMLLYGLISATLGIIDPGKIELVISVVFVTLGFVEATRVGVLRGLRQRNGKWIISIGSFCLLLFFSYQMLIDFNIIRPIAGLYFVHIFGFLGFLTSISVYIAYDFALTSRHLEHKLNEVRELSERTIAQERKAKEQEVEKRLLQAEDARKTKEFEEARNLQLSMLPACQNDIPGYDICFSMRTASEVGGDYYDYHYSKDKSLTIVVGDATGHGLKSGILVTVIKSLFTTEGHQHKILDFFARSSQTIKEMQLGNLYMALIFTRIKNKTLTVSSAGMPPALVYRHKTNSVEEILIKAMPLGVPSEFEYRTKKVKLESRDVILLMSDGYAELFNDNEEMLDYPRIKDTFKNNSKKSAKQIVNALMAEGDKWRKNQPQTDDITFACIKIES